MLNRQVLLLLAILITNTNTFAAAAKFSDERYRGWLWFEEQEKVVVPPNDNNKFTSDNPVTPEEARQIVETFKKELEDAKFLMIARPTVENIKAYKEKEQAMWIRGVQLGDNWSMVNFLNPEHNNHKTDPTNVHAVRLERELNKTKNDSKIKELASKVDLILFFREGCSYCTAFEPVLAEFSKKYGFNVEAVSLNNTESANFNTVNYKNLPAQIKNTLNIEAVPLVIAVAKESGTAFELIRGYVTVSELEEYSLMALQYLQTLNKKEG